MKRLALGLALLAAPKVPPPPAPFSPPYISVLAMGAKCDGRTDDTAALRAAIAKADTPPYMPIWLPPSTCLFSSQLVFGGHPDRYSEISVQGQSEYTSSLQYIGTQSPALLLSRMSAFRWLGFSIVGSGTGTGVQLDGPLASGGTQNTMITFDHVTFSKWHVGMMAGGSDAASEIECRNCRFDQSDIGWSASGYNSLNFWFYALHLTSNKVGMQLGGPWATDYPKIFGGDSAGNTEADFKGGNGFGQLIIDGFRAEVPSGGRFFSGACYAGQCIIRGATVLGIIDQPVMDLYPDGNFLIQSSYINGQINLLQSGGTIARIAIDGTQISEGSPGWPVIFFPGSQYRIRFTDNTRMGVWPASYYTDASGLHSQP